MSGVKLLQTVQELRIHSIYIDPFDSIEGLGPDYNYFSFKYHLYLCSRSAVGTHSSTSLFVLQNKLVQYKKYGR